jgi:ethanolamine permease
MSAPHPAQPAPHHDHLSVGVEHERAAEDYFEKRRLRRGAAGWVLLLLAGLGVAYVISGDFAGWNFGLAEGGWGGLVVSTALMAVMYSATVFGLAELASAIPVAGAGYGFVRRALGRPGSRPSCSARDSPTSGSTAGTDWSPTPPRRSSP